ncbi:MAG: hypothetical protein PHV07_04670 [Oscillospiraceae bacterium]|nr:hypothetical protein [Oscillospiraceae bacterium]
MNKIFFVCKAYYLSFFGINKALHSKDKHEKIKTFFTLLGIMLLGLLILGASFMYSLMIGTAYRDFGRPEALIAMMMAASSIICLATTISKGSSVIFTSRDYNIIMSLPVKTSDIIIAKLIVLYGMNLVFTLFVMIPATIVFGVFTAAPVVYYLVALIMMLFIPIVPLIIGTILSILIGIIAGHFKFKNIVNILLMLIFTVGVMFLSFSFSFNVDNPEQLFNIGNTIIATFYNIYPLTQMYTLAVSGVNILFIFTFIVISAVFGVLFSWIVSLKFKQIYTYLTSTKSTSNYKMQELKNSRPLKALYIREVKRYIASPIYIFNTAFGAVMLLIAGVISVVSQETLLQAFSQEPMLANFVNVLIPMIISIFVGMTNTTDVSISMEGKSLGIIKSLPVRTADIFLAKILVNLTINIPTVLIAATLFSISFKPGLFIIVMSFLIPLIYSFFTAVFGIVVNLIFPVFDWTNEAAVVKQSVAAMVGILGGMALSILPTIIVGFLKETGLIIVLALVTLATILLIILLKNWGQRKFLKLH